MWVADMDFKTPNFIINAIKERTKHEVFGYSFRSDSYFESIVNWVKRRHQWKINSEWISFSPGIVPAVNMAVMAYTNPENPELYGLGGDTGSVRVDNYRSIFDIGEGIFTGNVKWCKIH